MTSSPEEITPSAMTSDPTTMKDLNYFHMDLECNIYGLTTLQFEDGTSKVLVAASDCRIYCINYNKFQSQTREIEFTYIPNGAEIISIGALKRGPNDYAIGITHSMPPTKREDPGLILREMLYGEYARPFSFYLNIYVSGSQSTKFDLDYVAQGCQTTQLSYVPLYLYSTDLVTSVDLGTRAPRRRPYWLLTGGDNSVHAYAEQHRSFVELPIEECLPELRGLQDLALWIDVLSFELAVDCFGRAVALGCENGNVRLFYSTLTRYSHEFQPVKEFNYHEFTTIVPSVRLFRIQSSPLPRLLDEPSKATYQDDDNEWDAINLLAVNSTQGAVVFEDVLNNGLSKVQKLPGSQRLDSAVTSAIGDTNQDGLNELLIGTHGQELLIYRYNQELRCFELGQMNEFNHPVYAIHVADLTGDGLNDVIVLQSGGISVMQTDVRRALGVCKRRVDALLASLKALR